MAGMTYTLLHAGVAQGAGLMSLPKAASDAGMKPSWLGYIGWMALMLRPPTCSVWEAESWGRPLTYPLSAESPW